MKYNCQHCGFESENIESNSFLCLSCSKPNIFPKKEDLAKINSIINKYTSNPQIGKFIEKIFSLLEKECFEEASLVINTALTIDNDCGFLYFLSLLQAKSLCSFAELMIKADETILKHDNYRLAMLFANEDIEEIDKILQDFIEYKKVEENYLKAMFLINEGQYSDALLSLKKYPEYKNTPSLLKECNFSLLSTKVELAKRNGSIQQLEDLIISLSEFEDYKEAKNCILECKYEIACRKMQEIISLKTYSNPKYDVVSLFNEIIDYKDSKSKIDEYKECEKNYYSAYKFEVNKSLTLSLPRTHQFMAVDIQNIFISFEKNEKIIADLEFFKDEFNEINKKYIETSIKFILNEVNLSKLIFSLPTVNFCINKLQKYKSTDAENLIKKFNEIAERLIEKERKKKRKKIKKLIISFSTCVFAIFVVLFGTLFIHPTVKQNSIYELIDSKLYEEAAETLYETYNFGSYEKIEKLINIGQSLEIKDYSLAQKLIEEINGTIIFQSYKDQTNQSTSKEGPEIYTLEYPPKKEGYTFVNWEQIDYNFDSINSSVIVYLEPIFSLNSYKISYDLAGGINNPNNLSSYTVETEDFTILDPSRDGYEFTGWKSNNTTTPTKNIKIQKGSTGDKAFKATWEAKSYKITISDPFYCIDKDEYIVIFGEEYNLPEPSMVGYTFVGYFYDDKQIPLNGIYNIPNDIELSIKWEENTDTKYVINHCIEDFDGSYSLYKSEKLKGVTDDLVVVHSIEITGFTPKVTSATLTIKPDGTSYYEFYYTRNSYKLSFVSNGGTPVEDITLKYDEKLDESTVTYREGFTFDGWYELESKTKLTRMPAYDTTVYACYSEEQHFMGFNYRDNGFGITITSYDINYGVDVSIPMYINDLPVTEISKNAFYGDTIKSIKMPDTITIIGENAFSNCSSLSSIIFSKSLETISTYAFYSCNSLNEINLPASLTYIDCYAFNKTSAIDKVYINSKKLTIESYSFKTINSLYFNQPLEDWFNITSSYNAFSIVNKFFYHDGIYKLLDHLETPESVTNIKSYQFQSFKCIESAVVHDNVTGSLYGTFNNCTALKELTIGDGVTSISYFQSLPSLETLYLGSSIRKLSNSWSNTNDRIIKTIYFKVNLFNYLHISQNSSSIIGAAKSFYLLDDNNDWITLPSSLIIPNGIKVVPTRAFSGVKQIKSVYFSNDVEIIGTYAFYNCTNLYKIYLPAVMPVIESQAFSGISTSITIITYSSESISNPPSSYKRTTTIPTFATEGIEIKWCDNIYYFVDEKNEASIIGTDSVDEIDISINLNGYKVSKIYKQTFCYDKQLNLLSLPKDIWIEGSTFNGVTITDFMYHGTLTDWCKLSFEDEYANPLWATKNFTYLNDSYDFIQLTDSLVIPEDVTSINPYAFVDLDTQYTKVYIHEFVTTIGCYAFYGGYDLRFYIYCPSKPDGWDDEWYGTNNSTYKFYWNY